MPITDNVHIFGEYADKAWDEQDVSTLKSIAEACFSEINKENYNSLEKGILAYHGATSFSNYIQINYNGALRYTDKDNNEIDFEMCLFLYRKSIYYLNEFLRDLSAEGEEDSFDIEYCQTYLVMAYTNLANILQKCGRIIKGLSYLKIGLKQGFPMAVGNFAGFLIDYAHSDYDDGHQALLANKAFQLLKEVLTSKSNNLHNEASSHFENLAHTLKSYYPQDFLENPYEFKEYSLGDCQEEIEYRKWCLKHVLFLNTLNDAFTNSLVANDILHLPSMTTNVNETPRIHGLFNQIKQEFVSARYMVFEGLKNNTVHFSDKDVYLVNTLDYPVYGIGIEKIKYAYRSLYSLFDRMAYLINDYFELGIKSADVSFKSIWHIQVGRGKNKYKLNVNLKERMTSSMNFNLPLIGFYWLCKDVQNKKLQHNYLDPTIERLAKIRHHLEHRYLKIHDTYLYPIAKEMRNKVDDPLAYSVTVEEIENAVMELLSYVREGIILLSLLVHVEEKQRENSNTSEKENMYLDSYDDEWKQ